MIARYPEEMLERAIQGMLPKTKLGNAVFKKLFVYRDNGKDHSAQQPVEIKEGVVFA
jgi:large subunit ribosomal protein L13